MASQIRNLAGWSLFAVYGALALLGHAGMHALEGGHSHTHAAGETHAHPHSHDHGCCHHHPHTAADEQPAGEQHQHHDGHDHDNCLICHHFAAKAALVAASAPLNLAAGLEQVACVEHERTAVASRYVLPIRGPPAIAC